MSTLIKDGKKPILRDISNISYGMKQIGLKNDLEKAQLLKDNGMYYIIFN